MNGVTAVPGVLVGHWQDPVARTGCTVTILPPGTVASGEVRGGAPGTREWALLDPTRRVDQVDAVVLTGGSAFGLAACDGVVRWCAEQGRGFPTLVTPVPIVVGMVLYDLAAGDGSVRPDAANGYAACVAASDQPVASGAVGAGTGATINKWRGLAGMAPGGLGSTLVTGDDGLLVAALVAVNSLGGLRPAAGGASAAGSVSAGPGLLEATTIGLVVTNAVLTKTDCYLTAQSAHDGLARAIDPAHLSRDGDALVAAATGVVRADLDTVRALAAATVEAAIRDAIAAAAVAARAPRG